MAVDRHRASVCAIRRKCDGYWLVYDQEHGFGWNDKRIRCAWTPRVAGLVLQELWEKGVLDPSECEIVELGPKRRAGEVRDV